MRVRWGAMLLLSAGAAALVTTAVFLTARYNAKPRGARPETAPPHGPEPNPSAFVNTNPPQSRETALARRIRSRAGELTDAEKQEFRAAFGGRLKPALVKWCQAYEGRIPFSAERVTLDSFAERIGRDAAHYEYVFVVDGVTLGIRESASDSGGLTRVAYLNAPQSKQLMELPNGAGPPSFGLPITKEEVARMLRKESGVEFEPGRIRMIPTGASSVMNGGARVEVGGDPHNFLSWQYTLVFGPDGKLAYYSKGLDILSK